MATTVGALAHSGPGATHTGTEGLAHHLGQGDLLLALAVLCAWAALAGRRTILRAEAARAR